MEQDGFFYETHRRLAGRLERSSRTQRVPGLTTDEIHAEMLECLWRACSTYDEGVGTNIEQWWWVIWVRRKSDLIERFFTLKRRSEVLMEPELVNDLAPLIDDDIMLPPVTGDPAKVWLLLLMGYNGVEVRELLHLSVRRFYNEVDQIRAALSVA